MYGDTGFLLEKICACNDNPENVFTKNVGRHTACNHSIFTLFTFDDEKNKLDDYKDKIGTKKQRPKRACNQNN